MPADKGQATDIMNYSKDYHHKLIQLLNEDNTYRVAPSDPTSVIERKLRELLQTLKKITKLQKNNINF